MKKITIILVGGLVRRVYPSTDDKTIVFFAHFLITIVGILWPIYMEVYDARHKWADYDFDLDHLWKTHGPGAMLLLTGFWNMTKAYNLRPDWLLDIPTGQMSVINVDPPKFVSTIKPPPDA